MLRVVDAFVSCHNMVVNRGCQHIRKHDEGIKHDDEEDEVEKKLDDVPICPIKPPDVSGRFAAFDPPNHAQKRIRVLREHDKGEDIEGEGY